MKELETLYMKKARLGEDLSSNIIETDKEKRHWAWCVCPEKKKKKDFSTELERTIRFSMLVSGAVSCPSLEAPKQSLGV